MVVLRYLGWITFGLLIAMSSQATELRFRPVEARHAAAAAHYEAIWREHGARIVAALERETCRELPAAVAVDVLEAVSYSGDDRHPMRLRASYPHDLKRGTLVHELAHRVVDGRAAGLSSHQALDLLLLRVLPELYGEDFIGPQIAAESRWSRDYASAWTWALGRTPAERERHWRRLSACRPESAGAMP